MSETKATYTTDAALHAFEEWWATQGRRQMPEANVNVWVVWNAAWQAAEQAQREKDAAIALEEKVEDVGPGDEAYNNACDHIAQAIREQGAGT
jgi:hypothetical protein